MLRQSVKSNEIELQFAALGAMLNLLVGALMIIAIWQVLVLLINASQLIAIFPRVLAEVR